MKFGWNFLYFAKEPLYPYCLKTVMAPPKRAKTTLKMPLEVGTGKTGSVTATATALARCVGGRGFG